MLVAAGCLGRGLRSGNRARIEARDADWIKLVESWRLSLESANSRMVLLNLRGVCKALYTLEIHTPPFRPSGYIHAISVSRCGHRDIAARVVRCRDNRNPVDTKIPNTHES